MWMLARFYRSLLGFTKQETPLFFWITKLFIIMIMAAISISIFAFSIEIMQWSLLASLLYLLLIVGYSVYLIIMKHHEGGLIFVAAALGLAGVLGTVLSLNGIVSGGVWLRYSYTIGILFSVFIFQVILSRRLRQIARDHTAVMLQKNHAEQIAKREKAEKEQKSQFLSMLAHELKTSLSVIRMGVDQKQPSEKSRAHLLQAINDMSQVIDRCSVLEKVDDQVPMHLELLDVINLINYIVSTCQQSERIDLSMPVKEVLIESDEDWLKVILFNLLDNAMKYSPSDTVVKVSLTMNESTCNICFENLSQEDVPHQSIIFNKYYRGKTAYKQTGSGLGLYIVKRLVDQLHGHIDYKASPVISEHESKIPPFTRVSFELCLPIKP